MSPSLDFVYNIPVVTIPLMGFDGPGADSVDDVALFLSFAEELAHEPVVIVDVRGNPGGNGLLPTRWFYALTGEIIHQNNIWFTTSEHNPTVWEYALLNPYGRFSNPAYTHWLRPSVKGIDGYTIGNYEPRRVIEREQLLVLLVDRHTGSAAEAFADMTFNITNALVIGMPTVGAMSFDMTFPRLWLPSSGMPFGFGTVMSIYPDGHLDECRGIQPDIWVYGDALDAAIAMLRNAGFGDCAEY